jgi:hypothetical protein
MKRIYKYILGLLAAAALLGSVAFAYAAPAAAGLLQAQATPHAPAGEPLGTQPFGCGPPGQEPGGKVTAINGSTLTLTTADNQTLTVTVSSQTKVTVLGTQTDGSLSDIKVGHTLRVMGQPGISGAIDAQAIVIVPAGDQAGGKVTAVNGAAITVQTRDGTATITTDASTKFTLAAGKTGSLADVTTGMFVDAFGQKQADGSLLATLVSVADQPAQGPGPRGPGAGQPANPPMPGGAGASQP